MNRAMLCTGEYASTPYYFEKVYVNLYSIEELCFVLYENAFLIEKDILDIHLVEWIEKECKLPELARELYTMINHGTAPGTFVSKILEYVGYYTAAEISKTESILRLNAGKNAFEKWKAKADFMCDMRHYLLAIKEYNSLLEVLPAEEVALTSRVHNNMGVAYMRLYIYDSAEKCFMRAYKLDGNRDALRHYLTVKKMALSENEYIQLVSSDDVMYQVSADIEENYERANEQFEATDEKRHLDALFELRNRPDAALYYEEIDKIADRMKEDYRDIVLDSEKADLNIETTL